VGDLAVIDGVTLGAAPTFDAAEGGKVPNLRLTVAPLTATNADQFGVPPATRGLVVTAVDPSSVAAQVGIQQADVVLSINREPTLTPADATAVVE
jgi:serine protease Do